MKYTVTEVHQVWYRGGSDGPVDIPWATNVDEIAAIQAVASILDTAREPNTDRFPSLKSITHGIRIDLVPEES
jgi:hypothetical protein